MSEEKKQIDLEADEERLLNYLVDNEIKEINPTIRYNSISYDLLEDFKRINRVEDINQLLKNLTVKGYFDESEYDRSIFCSNCGSIHKQSKYNCPQCGSIKVKRYELIEHSTCGHIAERKEFLDEEKKLVCPSCSVSTPSTSKKKSEGEFIVIGTSYACDNCGYKFDKPEVTHLCQNCGTVYDYKDSIYDLQYSYTLTDKITEITPIRQIRDVLRTVESIMLELGYEVKLDRILEGKSGEKRILDIVAEKSDNLFLIDLSHWGKEEDILSLLGKKMDLDAKATVLIDVSGTDTMNHLGEIYEIKVFNGKDPAFSQLFSDYMISFEEQEEKPKGFTFSGLLGRREEPETIEKEAIVEEVIGEGTGEEETSDEEE
jgi:transposase-like protein